MLNYGMDIEELRTKGKVLSRVVGSGHLLKTSKTFPFYTVEGKYETVRYGTLTRFIAYIPDNAVLIYDSRSTCIYQCNNGIFAEFYKGNAEIPSEFIIYLYES
jgi:hypothetical protein